MAWDNNFRLPEHGFFSSDQRDQLAAIFRVLHPSDPGRGIPGADEAGAADFVSLLLAPGTHSSYEEIADWRLKYPGWLASLDQAAIILFTKGLTGLSAAQMIQFLTSLEGGALAGVADQKTMFKTLWRHCLQGCWSDPRWGGNRDGVMWRWLGYLQEAQNVSVGQASFGEGGHAHD